MIGNRFKRKAPFEMSRTEERRYEYEKDAYRLFLNRMSDRKPKDLCYLDFMIDLLRKEVKYSSLLEINRGNTKDRFLYPFHRMCDKLIGAKYTKDFQIDLKENNLISAPWDESRYKGMLKWISKQGFQYQRSNHMAYYYEYINIACAYNGVHSLGVGTYFGNGTIKAKSFDTTKIFPYVEANCDLSFSYNEENVLRRMEEKKITMDGYIEQELSRRFYGTDYRLILLYKLCQEKYFMERETEENLASF